MPPPPPPPPQSVSLVSLVISGPEMYFNSVEDIVSFLYFIWIVLPPALLLLFSLPPMSSLGIFPPNGSAWVAHGTEGDEGGIREARRRLVRYGTLSFKYPEVFFPRNCRSSSFLGSLNGPGYPERIEKLPLLSLSLSLSLSLLLSLFLRPSPSFYLALVPFAPPRFSSRSNLYAPPPRKQPPITRRG